VVEAAAALRSGAAVAAAWDLLAPHRAAQGPQAAPLVGPITGRTGGSWFHEVGFGVHGRVSSEVTRSRGAAKRSDGNSGSPATAGTAVKVITLAASDDADLKAWKEVIVEGAKPPLPPNLKGPASAQCKA
jgi:hypothetical protein